LAFRQLGCVLATASLSREYGLRGAPERFGGRFGDSFRETAVELRHWAEWGCAIGLAAILVAAPALAQRTRPTPPAPVPADDQAPPPAGPSRGENFSLKPPAQLFASDCTGAGCHRGPQGLGKNVGAFGLTSFLRQHYTNSQQSAAALANYLSSIPGDARPTASKKGEPKAKASTEPPDGTPKQPAEKQEKKTPAAAAKQPQRKQATADQPAAAAPAPAAPAPDAPTAAPVPPAPKVFDIFD